MSKQVLRERTCVLLSFNGTYSALARRIESDLSSCHISVRFDKWEGGGGVPARQTTPIELQGIAAVLVLLSPGAASATWVSEEWTSAIYEKAEARGVLVLPLLGDGDIRSSPELLRHVSFADLRERNYTHELRRLIATLKEHTGDAGITLPDTEAAGSGSAQAASPSEPLALEFGGWMAEQLEGQEGSHLKQKLLPMMWDGLFYELGVSFPPLTLRTEADMPPSSICIRINGVPEEQTAFRPGFVLVNDRASILASRGFSADAAVNPANGGEAAWVPEEHVEAIRAQGLITWNGPQFLILTLSSVLRRRAAHFIDIDVTRQMLAQIEPVFPKLVAETVPKTVSLFLVTDVLRRLVAELVSIRNMRRILMALADWGRFEQDPLMLTEYVRVALRRQIVHQLSRGSRSLIVLLLDPEIEAEVRDAIKMTATGTYLDLDPSRLGRIFAAIREPMDRLPGDIQVPPILTTQEIRSSVRRLVALHFPKLHVISCPELDRTTDVRPVGRISLDGFRSRHAVTADGLPVWKGMEIGDEP